MNGKVVLSEQVMEEQATIISQSAESIKSSLDIIKSEISAINDVWQDKNASVYLERFDNLQKDFPAFYNSVYAFSSFLKGVVKAYRESVMEPTSRAVNSINTNN